MTRYYHNENPQVELWKEKAIGTQKEFDKYREFAVLYNEIIVNALNELTDKATYFNSLPWYKKMFYKFKI